MVFSISVQEQDFDVGREYNDLMAGDKSAGAVVFFVGRVRDMNDGKRVSSLSLEHYSGMTEKILNQLLDNARQRWDLTAARIVHRVGALQLGDQIVFVGAASVHRKDAFDAAEYLMDFLKTRAPFWKKELTASGEMIWVDGKEDDERQLARWS